MMSSSRTGVSAELGLGLVGPERMIVPLTASLSYRCSDPYAIRMAFDVGTDEPVEWILARDLLAAALHAREGIGDVQVWQASSSSGGDRHKRPGPSWPQPSCTGAGTRVATGTGKGSKQVEITFRG